MKIQLFSKNAIRTLAIIACLIGVIALVIAQITYSQNATKLEVSLFNTLQFIFSLLFAWLLSSSVSESHFRDTQRKFAISAFRRIKEIERSLLRLQSYLKPINTNSHEQMKEAVSVIKVSLNGAQDNVRSSIADWSDVIGSEIEVAHEVTRLKSLREEIAESESRDVRGVANDDLTKRIDEINEQIDTLKKELPVEILNSIDDENEIVDIDEFVGALDSEMKKNDHLSLNAYWETEDSFSINPAQITTGDPIILARSITENRSDVILVLTKDKQSIGVLLNKLSGLGGDYDTFCFAMREYFGKSILLDTGDVLEGVITNIDEKVTHDDGIVTQHFTLEINKNQLNN